MDLDLELDPMVEAEYRAEELAQELADVLRLPVEVAVILDEGGEHEGSVRMRAVPLTETPPELRAVPDATS